MKCEDLSVVEAYAAGLKPSGGEDGCGERNDATHDGGEIYYSLLDNDNYDE